MKYEFAQVFDVCMTVIELKSMYGFDRAQGCDCLLPPLFALILRTIKAL